MTVRLSDLVAGTRALRVPYGKKTIEIVYRLGERTGARDEEILAQGRAGKPESAVAEIVRLVESWDIVGQGGKALPVTAANVSKLPIPVLRAIGRAIYSDSGADDESENGAFPAVSE